MEEKDVMKEIEEKEVVSTVENQEDGKKVNETETREVKNEKVTDEELYAKIQTEKMLKNQKIKKISIISVLSVVFALAVVIICLASIPLNLKPVFLNQDYVAKVFIGGESYAGTLSNDTNQEEYNKLRELVDSAFNQTYFSGLFNGSLSNYNFTESRTPYSTFLDTLKNDKESNYVTFEFSQEQTLKNRDGSVYESTRSTRVKSFKFTNVYMQLSDKEGDNNVTFYVVVQYINTSTGESIDEKTKDYVIKMTTVGQTYPIFEHFNPNDDAE